MAIILRLGNVYSEIETPLSDSQHEIVRAACSYEQSVYVPYGPPKTRRVSLYNENKQTFPSGLHGRVKKALREEEFKVTFNDVRNHVNVNLDKAMERLDEFSKPFRDYQIEGIIKGIENPSGLFNWSTGCHKKGQKILLFNGKFKKVENIKIGDTLMGPDNKPRTVLKLIRGFGKMYDINPVKGKSFTVNEDHILTLKLTGTKRKKVKKTIYSEIIDITVKDWINLSSSKKHVYKLFRVGAIFTKNDQDIKLPIDPYTLGVFLGDGSLRNHVNITTMDNAIERLCYRISNKYKLKIRKDQKKDSKCWTYHFSNGTEGIGKRHKNPLIEIFRNLNLLGTKSHNKFIPSIFKYSSKKQRLKLLAGLLDTDGCCDKKSSYAFSSKSKKLAYGVAFLARSVGLAAYVRKVRKKCSNSKHGTIGTYYGTSISGNTNIIPCKINRKKCNPRKQIKDALNTGFSTKYVGEDNYYGFTLDNDGRYLLDDFTVTHNSGKTVEFAGLLVVYDVPTLILTGRRELAHQLSHELGEMTGCTIGIIGDGEWNPSKWTVGIITTLVEALKSGGTKKVKVLEFLKKIRYIIIDETHHLGAATWIDLAKHCVNASVRHGFSGTCFHGESDDLYLAAYTGEVISKVTSSFLIPKYLGKPYIEMKDIDFDLPYSKTKNIKNWHQQKDVFIRNNRNVNREGCNFVWKHYKKGRQIICFSGADLVHGKNVLEGLLEFGVEERDIRFMNGKESSMARKSALDDFRNNRFQILIGTTIYDEGVDVPSLQVGANFGQGFGEVSTRQRIGRILRKTKATGMNDVDINETQKKWYWDPMNMASQITHKHSSFRRDIYKSEKEFVLLGQDS